MYHHESLKSETIFTKNLLRHDKAGTSSALFIWLKRRFSPRNSYAMEILEQVLNFSSGLNGIFHYNKD